MAVYDCIGATAPGVHIKLNTADDQTRSFRPDLTESDVTDQGGLLYFSNVPAGSVIVTATPVSLGRASSTATTVVRAGATTSLQMLPSP